MKLIDTLTRRPTAIAFGRSRSVAGTGTNALTVQTSTTSVTVQSADGSQAALSAANSTRAGVLSASDKAKLDALTVGGNGGAVMVASAAQVATLTIDAGAPYLITAGFAAPGDGGGAMYVRSATNPAHALKLQSGDGAFWALAPQDGTINIRAAGAKGDGVTDDRPALLAAIAAFQFQVNTQEAAGCRILIDPGVYFMAGEVEINTTVTLEGVGYGTGTTAASILKFPAGSPGLTFNRFNTRGGGVEAPDNQATKGADGSILRNLRLLGGGGTFGQVADGIRARCRITIEDVAVRGFARDGINIDATVGAPLVADEGNANLFVLKTVQARDNLRDGVRVEGADANAGLGYMVDATQNGRFGIFDASFLGNTWVACHAAFNGVGRAAGAPASLVSFGGNRWGAKIGASEAQLVNTQPGTDAAVWYLVGPGAVSGDVPAWVAGRPVGTFVVGGAYAATNDNARTGWIGCYSEGGQASTQIATPAMVLGGLHGAGVIGTGYHQEGRTVRQGGLDFAARDFDSAPGVEMALRQTGNTYVTYRASGDHPNGLGLRFNPTEGAYEWLFANLAADGVLRLLGDGSTRSFGRSTTVKRRMQFQHPIWIGNANASRALYSGTAKPATTDHGVGDLTLNAAAGDGAPMGWVFHNGAHRALPLMSRIDGAVTLPHLTVAELAAQSPQPRAGTMVWCLNGAAGGPCPANFTGTAWVNTYTGTAVSAV